MKKIAILLMLGWVGHASAGDPNLLFYEGFDYPAGSQLAGQVQQPSGNAWSLAPSSNTQPPVIVQDSVWKNIGLPAATGNDARILHSGGNSVRINLPNVPTGEKTMYWSGFLRVDDINTLGAYPGSGNNQAGAFVAGFNELTDAGGASISQAGAYISLKRASGDSDNPKFFQYYLGTGASVANTDCTAAGNYRCGNRYYADYDPAAYAAGELIPEAYRQPVQDQWWASTFPNGQRPLFTAVPLQATDPVRSIAAQTVFVVGAYHLNPNNTAGVGQPDNSAFNDTTMLWINPDPSTFGKSEAERPAANISATTIPSLGSGFNGTDLADVKSFFLRGHTGGNVSTPDDFRMDEIRVGKTWSSVTFVPNTVAGDYNSDGKVDASDYVIWRKDPASHGGISDGYTAWRTNFGSGGPGAGSDFAAVPEPAGLSSAMIPIGLAIVFYRRTQRNKLI